MKSKFILVLLVAINTQVSLCSSDTNSTSKASIRITAAEKLLRAQKSHFGRQENISEKEVPSTTKIARNILQHFTLLFTESDEAEKKLWASRTSPLCNMALCIVFGYMIKTVMAQVKSKCPHLTKEQHVAIQNNTLLFTNHLAQILLHNFFDGSPGLRTCARNIIFSFAQDYDHSRRILSDITDSHQQKTDELLKAIMYDNVLVSKEVFAATFLQPVIYRAYAFAVSLARSKGKDRFYLYALPRIFELDAELIPRVALSHH